jgi:hypothetical protein
MSADQAKILRQYRQLCSGLRGLLEQGLGLLQIVWQLVRRHHLEGGDMHGYGS